MRWKPIILAAFFLGVLCGCTKTWTKPQLEEEIGIQWKAHVAAKNLTDIKLVQIYLVKVDERKYEGFLDAKIGLPPAGPLVFRYLITVKIGLDGGFLWESGGARELGKAQASEGT